MIYLDNAANTPVLPEVLEAMLPWFRFDHVGNPGSIHAQGTKARRAIEKARRQIADNGYSYPSIDDTLRRLITIEHDNPHHEFSIGKHCLAAWSYLGEHYPNPDLVLSRATLLHDFGKESTKVFHNGRGNPTDIAHYYHHEHTSAYDSFTYTTDMSDEDRLKVALLVRWHMWPYVVEKSDNPSKTLRRVIQLLGEDIWKQIMVLHDCDLHAH